MDKYEYNLKLDQLKDLYKEKNYSEAAKTADEINWNKVRNINTLNMVGKIYEKTGRIEDAEEIYQLAYHRSPGSKNAVYRLCRIAIEQENVEEAEQYYNEFTQNAPHDAARFALAYQISCLKDEPLEMRIAILEDMKQQHFSEDWGYELAYLYYQAGQAENCVRACDDLVVWFGEGEYVKKALELKRCFRPLTPEQEQKYQQMLKNDAGVVEQEGGSTDSVQQEPEEAGADQEENAAQEAGTFDTSTLTEELDEQIDTIQNAQNIDQIQEASSVIRGLIRDIPQMDEADFTPLQEEQKTIQEQVNRELAENFRMLKHADEEAAEKTSKGTGSSDIDAILANWERTKRAAEDAIASARETELSLVREQALKEAGQIRSRLEDILPELQTKVVPEKADLFHEEGRTAAAPGVGAEKVSAEQQNEAAEIDMKAEQEQEAGAEQDLAADVQEILAQNHAEPVDEASSEKADDQSESKITLEKSFRPKEAVLSDDAANEEDWDDEDFFAETPPERKNGRFFGKLKRRVESAAKDAGSEEKDEPENLSDAPEEIKEEQAEILQKSKTVEEAVEVTDTADGEASVETEEEPSADADADTADADASVESTEEPVSVTDAADGEASVETEEEPSADADADTADANASVESTKEPVSVTDTADGEASVETGEAPSEDAEGTTEPAEETNAAQAQELSEGLKKESERIAELEAMLAKAKAEKKAMEEAAGKKVSEKSYVRPETANEKAETKEKDASFHAGFPQAQFFQENDEEDPDDGLPKLNQEQRERFSYFLKVNGMRQQIRQTLQGELKRSTGGITSLKGNITISGVEGTGKTVLATSLIKTIEEMRGEEGAKIGKISAASLNTNRDFRDLIPRLEGGYLIVEKAGELTRETILHISQTMEMNTAGLTVILEDTEEGIQKALATDIRFAAKFDQHIAIPKFGINELVAFGVSYAKEMECTIDDMGILAMYNQINNILSGAHPTPLTEVKKIVDRAIESAERGGGKKRFGKIFSKRYNDNDYLILREENFEPK